MSSGQAELPGPGEVPDATKLRFSSYGAMLGLQDGPFLAPVGPAQPQTPQGESQGTERQRGTPGQGEGRLLGTDRGCGEG